MNNTYALIQNGIVTNLIVWDGADALDLPSGVAVQQVPADTFVEIGYKYDGTTFSS